MVLVAGGIEGDIYLASAELYDPATGTWSDTDSLSTGREFHTATLLPNGKVLVAGGRGSDFVELASAELYDPATGTWSATGSLNTARYDHTATLLPNGMCSWRGEARRTDSAELYDPATASVSNGSLTTGEQTMSKLSCPTAWPRADGTLRGSLEAELTIGDRHRSYGASRGAKGPCRTLCARM